ncbi:uncharacterized protein LOC125838030 [Solanum verrucosum]|uniref:uncharacterized protein LOC125838030 n=1 Tax=Solanum verrucosum TaxID=315347 RepID=UPI0020CFF305|nr:uncharacterized protein LOC125838030 [Solanum verrucosum]
MDVYVTLRFHHGGKLQQKPRIKYEGGIVIDCFDVDVDKLSYFEFVDIVKEIGYNCSACVVYIKPPKCRHVVEVKSDRDIMGIESSQTFEGSEGLGFEEAAQPEEPIVGEELREVLGRTSASAGEDLGRASAGVGEDLGRTYVSVGEDLGGTSFAVNASDIPEVGSDWESETEAINSLGDCLAFESVKQFREAITRYAVQEHVELDKYVNDATRVRVKCIAGGPWLLFGSIDSKTGDFVVKNYNPPGIRVFQFQILVKKKLNVYVGRTVARKARNITLKQIMGDHVEEFKRILDYRDELLRTNPGSTCVVRLSEETFEGGRQMFQSFYIYFDALKKAFKVGARRCIGFDGCFLKGVSRGQLLVVVCKDENN